MISSPRDQIFMAPFRLMICARMPSHLGSIWKSVRGESSDSVGSSLNGDARKKG